MKENNTQKSVVATVAIIGRPSAGKSTFLNTVTRQAVSIVSPVPQTTRNAIKGIVNTPRGQLIFIDTPGLHESQKKMNIRLKDITKRHLETADCILYIIDATRTVATEEKAIVQAVLPYTQKLVVAINKIDVPKNQKDLIKGFVQEQLPQLPKEKIFFMCAKSKEGAKNTQDIAGAKSVAGAKDVTLTAQTRGTAGVAGVKGVLESLFDMAKQGEPLYPQDYYTDQGVAFRVCEVIRGQAINLLSCELPHAIYVDIADIEFKDEGKKLWVRAFLCVERESQKGIVIGKKACMIQKIKVNSLKELKKIFDYKIELNLQVKVQKNWRQKDVILNKLLTNC